MPTYNTVFGDFSVKEGMFLHTEDFLDAIKDNLNAKLKKH